MRIYNKKMADFNKIAEQYVEEKHGVEATADARSKSKKIL